MPLKLGKLGIPSQTFYVQKTGFPFFDACQLVGAMHMFFGSATSTVRDCGLAWVISGSDLKREAAQVAFAGDRLKGKGLERIEQTTLGALETLEANAEEIGAYYAALPPKTEVMAQAKQDKVGRYLEPALLAGAKGMDAARYSVMASQKGSDSLRPLPELLVATLGLTFAALAYGNDEVMTVLPVLESPKDENLLKPLTPFFSYQQRYQHNAGGAVSGVHAGMSILENLGRKYRIADFAYAYHGGRGFYYSGLLGLHRLCQGYEGLTHLAQESLNFFERSKREEVGLGLDMARLLADFMRNPSIKTLESIAKTKARMLANEENARLSSWVRHAAEELLGNAQSIREAGQLVKDNVPKPTEALTQPLGMVFRREIREGKPWIGHYVQLERANDKNRFFEEISKILSRAMAAADRQEDKTYANTLRKGLSALTAEDILDVPGLSGGFRTYKTTFLLQVLASMRYQEQATRPATPSVAPTDTEEENA